MTVSEGLIINSVNGKWGAFNELGDIIVPFIYAEKGDYIFVNGFAMFYEKVGEILYGF